MKGQILVFEQVMLFSAGVAIFIVLFTFFTIYQEYFVSVGIEDQLNSVNNWITSNILKISSRQNSSIILPIPKRIGNEIYMIKLDNNGLNVTNMALDITKTSNIYGLGKLFNLSGRVLSTGGRILIYKKGNEIILK